VLGDTFVLEANGMAQHPFRIAGTRLCALFCRELKGESFLNLWQRSGQAAVRDLITAAMEEKAGVVASVSGTTTDPTLLPISLELLLLPLAYQSRSDARVLGALAPMSVPYWLGAKPVGPLTLGTFRHVGAAVDDVAPPRFKPAAGKLKHGLTIYDGGRAE
jgi:hypothetical protein